MKKFYNNYLMKAALLMAGAAITACSNNDDAIAEQIENTTHTYLLSVNASLNDGVLTRALSGGFGTEPINFTWTADDNVDVYKNTNEKIGTLIPQTYGGPSTTLKGTITGTINNGDNLNLYLHNRQFDYTEQTGSFESAASKDFALATVSVTDVSTTNITTESANFEPGQAIVRFSLFEDDGTTPINATSLKIRAINTQFYAAEEDALRQSIRVKNSPQKGPLTINATSATNVFYVALNDLSTGGTTLWGLTATTENEGTYNYTLTATGQTFKNGNYYTVNVKMKKHLTLDLTSPEVGQIIGSDGKNYNATIGELPDGVTKLAMIAYVSGSKGLAITLNDISLEMNHSHAEYFAQLQSPSFTNATWRLPTDADWLNMFKGCGDTEATYNSINYTYIDEKLEAVGSTKLLVSGTLKHYWASSSSSRNDVFLSKSSSSPSKIATQNLADTYKHYVRSALVW